MVGFLNRTWAPGSIFIDLYFSSELGGRGKDATFLALLTRFDLILSCDQVENVKNNGPQAHH